MAKKLRESQSASGAVGDADAQLTTQVVLAPASSLASMVPADLVLALRAEIRDLAQSLLRGERPGHTLQPTALLGELWLRLADQPDLRFECREQFIAYAAASIRHILVDHARRRLAQHRGGGWQRVRLHADIGVHGDEPLVGAARDPQHWAQAMAELDEELELLRNSDFRSARVFELRFFGGMTVDQVAGVLGVSDRTVRKDWVAASAWLRSRLEARDAVRVAASDPSPSGSSTSLGHDRPLDGHDQNLA